MKSLGHWSTGGEWKMAWGEQMALLLEPGVVEGLLVTGRLLAMEMFEAGLKVACLPFCRVQGDLQQLLQELHVLFRDQIFLLQMHPEFEGLLMACSKSFAQF